MENKLKEEVAKRLKSTVAERLKSLMEKKNLNQTEFSEITGISKDTVSKLVNENYSLSILNALLISEKFGVSLDYLYGRCEEANRNQYAFEILQKHFCVLKKASFYDKLLVEAHFSCSEALATLLVKLARLEESDLDDDIHEIVKQRAKEDFLKVIEDVDQKSRDFVLLDAAFYNPEVRTAFEKAKGEMRGTRRHDRPV